MYEWRRLIQSVVDEIDQCILNGEDEKLTLRGLAKRLGYSEYHMTRKFREIAGMPLRNYLRLRRMAFALREVRDSQKTLLEIAVEHGFSSHEAFTRAFKSTYGITPSSYRAHPRPLVLRTRIHPFDRYLLGLGEIGMVQSQQEVKVYFITIPAHKFLHVQNRESNGYWDFWQKQSMIEGQDCETICGLLDSIPGKLDDHGGRDADCGSGHVMGYLNDPSGRLCDWGFLRTECYGARLPAQYNGEIPPQMQMLDVPEGEYIVFEHGPFDYEQECRTVEEKIEAAMRTFDYESSGYQLDDTPGRIMYFYFEPEQYFKYIRPVRKG